MLLLGALCPSAARAVLEQNSVIPSPATALSGIGAVLHTEDGYATVTQVVPGGPADRDGRLKVNDRVIAVAQPGADFVSCANMALDKVVAMIRGVKGTEVRLQVLGGGALQNAQPRIISLVRDQINIVGGQPVAQPSPKTTLTDDQQKQVQEILRKLRAARRKSYIDDLNGRIDDFARTVNLDPDHRKMLVDAVEKAVDQSLEKSNVAIHVLSSDQLAKLSANQIAKVLSSMSSMTESQLEAMARSATLLNPLSPTDQPVWPAALKQALTPEQMTAWTAMETKREHAADPEMTSYLRNVAQRAANMESRQLAALSDQIQLELDLPPERVEKLNALAKSIAVSYGDAAAAETRKKVAVMLPEARKQVIQNSVIFDFPRKTTKAWTDGLAKILTPDELQRLQTSKADRQDRLIAALASVFISIMDDRIAFTADQRAKLEPIARAAIKNSPNLLNFNQQQADYFNIPDSSFYAAAAAADPDQVQAILDATQWRHWREAAEEHDSGNENEYSDPVVSLPDITSADKPPHASEPEEVETAISDYLARKFQQEEKLILPGALLRADDITRVAHLSDAPSRRLQTAARAAAEIFLGQWKQATEMSVRSSLGDVTPDTVKQRLDSIQTYSMFSSYSDDAVGGGNVWSATLHECLTPAQLQAWRREKAARESYGMDAITALVVSNLGATAGLSSGQMDRLAPMVRNILKEYGPDIPGMGMGNGGRWYLQSYTEFMPVQGIPAKDLGGLLGKEQMDRWKGSPGYSYTVDCWQNVVSAHQERVNNHSRGNRSDQ